MEFGSPNLGLPSLAMDPFGTSSTPRSVTPSRPGSASINVSGLTQTTPSGRSYFSQALLQDPTPITPIPAWGSGSASILRQDSPSHAFAWGQTNGGLGHSLGEPKQDWERKIETLDQKEMEIHQTQLRLIREQTANFRGDLLALRQEVATLRGDFAKHSGVRLQELAEGLTNSNLLHQETDRKLAQLNDNVQNHHRALQLHAAMKERMEYLEKFIGDSAEQQQRQLDEAHQKAEQAHAKLEQVHGRLQTCELGCGDLKRTSVDRDARHVALAERVAFLEKLTGDSADKHSQMIDVLRNAQERQAKDSHTRHITVEQVHNLLGSRLQMVEACLGESTDKQSQATSTVSTVAGRLTALEKKAAETAEKHQADLTAVKGTVDKTFVDHAAQLTTLKTGQTANTTKITAEAAVSVKQDERLAAIDKALAEFTEKTNTEIADAKAARASLETASKGHGKGHKGVSAQVETLSKSSTAAEERFTQIEKVIGDGADKQNKEVAALKVAHGTHTVDIRDVFGRHVALQDRLEYLEKALGDSAEKHANAVNIQQQKLEQLHSKVGEQERERMNQKGELTATKDKLAQTNTTIEDRISYIEKAVGDSFEGHARELQELKSTHARLHGEGRESKAKHSTMEERLDCIESWLRGFRGPDAAVAAFAVGGTSPLGFHHRSAIG